MPKYSPLASELLRRGEASIQMSFDQVGDLVGGLPPSAFEHREWWSNPRKDTPSTHTHAIAGWIEAGYRVLRVDMNARTVRFESDCQATSTPDRHAKAIENGERANPQPESTLDDQCGVGRLTPPGFVRDGEWVLDGGKTKFQLERCGDSCNALYAFIGNGQVKYIGKTKKTLRQRMSQYQNPGPTQSTNIRINDLIRQAISNGATIEIYALPDNGRFSYGGFHLNIAAGLEDDLIAKIQPEWNAR